MAATWPPRGVLRSKSRCYVAPQRVVKMSQRVVFFPTRINTRCTYYWFRKKRCKIIRVLRCTHLWRIQQRNFSFCFEISSANILGAPGPPYVAASRLPHPAPSFPMFQLEKTVLKCHKKVPENLLSVWKNKVLNNFFFISFIVRTHNMAVIQPSFLFSK